MRLTASTALRPNSLVLSCSTAKKRADFCRTNSVMKRF